MLTKDDSHMIRTLKTLSVFSTIGMVFILLGGALVTKTDSGDGCGSSWPLCHGQIIPSEISTELMIEYSHRIVSSLVGIAIVILALLAWKYLGHLSQMKLLSFLSVFFLVAQGLFGAAAVVWGQSDAVLALHFGVSLLSFASVFLLTLLIFEVDQKLDTKSLFIQKRHRKEIYMLVIFTIIVVYTGALVRHVNAELACLDWPFCFNDKPFHLSNFNFYQWVHMGHRLFAAILFIWNMIFFMRVSNNYRHNSVMHYGWMITLGFLVLQVAFGAFIIFTRLELIVTLFHAFFITCYFGMITYYVLLSYRSARKESSTSYKRTKFIKPVHE